MWVPLGSTAGKEGRYTALGIGGVPEKSEELGSMVTRYFGFTMSYDWLNFEKQAKSSVMIIVSVLVTKLDRVGYMPEAKNITIKLIADKNTTRKLLGAGLRLCGCR